MRNIAVILAFIIGLLCLWHFLPNERSSSPNNPKLQSFDSKKDPVSIVENPDTLIARADLNSTGENELENAVHNHGKLRLISRADVAIRGLWIKTAGSWSIIQLETPGVVDHSIIDGAELIAPVGHTPEIPNIGGDSQKFGPWASLVIKGVPDNWAQSTSVVAPVLPNPEDVWQLVASGGGKDGNWTCLVQPSMSMLEEANSRLSKVRFPFELQSEDVQKVEIEISLAKSTVLVVDYQDLLQKVELIDLPVKFLNLENATKWVVHVIENTPLIADSNLPAVVDVPAGRVALPTSAQRQLSFESGRGAVIPDVRIGSQISLLASSSDKEWFAFISKMYVQKNSTVDFTVESGLKLVFKGLNVFTEGRNVDCRVAWWFVSNGVEHESNAPILQFKSGIGEEVEVRLAPSIWQMFELNGASVSSQELGVGIYFEDMATTKVLDIPLSREVMVEIKSMESESSTIIVRSPYSEIQDLRFVTIAGDHESQVEHQQCGLGVEVSDVKPGLKDGETEVILTGEGIHAFPQNLRESPDLLVFDWEKSSRYYLRGAGGVYEEIPMTTVELDFYSLAIRGDWKISWAFGCEKNLSFPLSLPLDTTMLPVRIPFEVPIQHAILLVDKKRIERIGTSSPVQIELK